MRIPSAVLTCVLTVLALTYTLAAEAACLSWNGPQTITGRLAVESYPGRPNYESIAAGDEEERVAVITLDQPACVAQDKSDSEGMSPPLRNVRKVQLAVQPGKLKGLFGMRVRATGPIWVAHTGHHHTPFLMDDPTVVSVNAGADGAKKTTGKARLVSAWTVQDGGAPIGNFLTQPVQSFSPGAIKNFQMIMIMCVESRLEVNLFFDTQKATSDRIYFAGPWETDPIIGKIQQPAASSDPPTLVLSGKEARMIHTALLEADKAGVERNVVSDISISAEVGGPSESVLGNGYRSAASKLACGRTK